ncbi:heavy-metal-associated domain-containing protein [Mucilaginibacter aquatilis]|uniref:Heavy-metal-associated domain-containing protein n=1 Tax=Mucilaginibacter aquatilis TaxID=1517760 RepID=A0A6I4I476_9SPHI|nr:heavy metal-associated domain-containing protein [Mucilaginibacter aquatilis]MVN89860.1 heavy-metal-associated domain-containing protein [Mucilaginibacter aquatilis]
MKHTYKVTGMTCAGCQYKVQHLLSQVPHVNEAVVNLERGDVTVEMDEHVNTTVLQDALKEYPKYQLTDVPVTSSTPISMNMEAEDKRTWFETYKPIVLIFFYIIMVSVIAGSTLLGFDELVFMRVFMAGFFLVFSFFKMLNLDGFADSYAMYDVIARKFKAWGYIYALLELALGLAYATNFNPAITNLVTLVIMSVSIVGVLQTVLNKKVIKCACLGAVFNLPMSTVTIIEDGLMIVMSAVMLWMM